MLERHERAPAAVRRSGADTEGVSFDASSTLLAMAVRLVAAMRRDIAYQHETTLGPTVRAYLDHLGPLKQPRTIDSYEETLRWMCLEFPSKTISEITPEDLGGWVARRWAVKKDGTPMRPATVRQRIAAIKSFFKWAIAFDLVLENENPTRRLESPPLRSTSSGRERHRVSEDVLAQLIDAQEGADRIALQLLGKMGLRRDEVRLFQLEDFDRETGYVTVKNGKGGKSRRLPTPLGLREDLREHITEEHGLGEYLISPRETKTGGGTYQPYAPTSMPYWWDGCLERAGLEDILMHEMRYTAASRLYEGCKDLVQVQRFLGHSNPTITERYLDLNVESLEDSILALG